MCYQIKEGFIYLNIYVKPKSQKSAIIGVKNNNLVIALNALPDKNQANQALVDFLAQQIKLSKTKISLIKGTKSRYKMLKLPYNGEVEIFLDNLNNRKDLG